MEHGLPVELSPQEAMMLIRIANEGDIGADNSDEGTVGLTLRGMQSVVRLRRS